MLKKIFLALLAILIIFLRGRQLTSNPVALFSDEVDAGYQAFTFNQCGTDYYGNFLPIHFHSYADWRTSLHIYSIALSEKIFGTNEFAVRFPAFIYGLLSIIVFTLLVKEVTNNSLAAFFAAAFFSLNPWFLHYSRGAWESSGLIFCLLCGLLFWFKSVNSGFSRPRFVVLSIIFFCASVYFYATAKLFIPVLFVAFLFIWRRQILNLKSKKYYFLLIVFLLLPLAIDIIRGTAGFRFSYINIFTDPTVPTAVDLQRLQAHLHHIPSKISYFFYNRFQVYLSKFVRNYFSSFSFDYLFLTGDNHPRQGFGQKGNFLYLDIFLFFIGIAHFLRQKKYSLIGRSLLLFLLLSPIPFSLTRDSASPQSTRLIIMIIPVLFFVAIGFSHLLQRHCLIAITSLFVYLLTFTDFYFYYFSNYQEYSANQFHYGLKQAIFDSYQHSDYQRIYYSNSYEPFVPFFLFYTQYLPSPGNCASAVAIHWDNTNFFSGMQTDNRYFFGQLEWGSLLDDQKLSTTSLFVVPEKEIPTIKQNLGPTHKQLIFVKSYPKDYTSQEPLHLITFK